MKKVFNINGVLVAAYTLQEALSLTVQTAI